MSSRIGELKLHLRIPGELEKAAAEIRSAVERKVIVAVIEELERRLDAALGAGTIVRIRRVSLRWTLEHDGLADHATIARLAGELERDLLAEIGAQSPAERLRPRSSTIVVFAGEAHAEAARLADLAAGAGDAWFHAGAGGGAATWEGVVARGAGAVEEVMTWLARMECVEPALELAPEGVLVRIAELAPARAGDVGVVQARRTVVGAARDATRADAPTSSATASPSAPVTHGAHPAEALALAPATTTVRVTPSTHAHANPHGPATADRDQLVVASRSAAADGSPALARATALVIAGDARAAGAETTPPAVSAPPRAPLHDGVALATEAAGLFYLVGRVLELDVAEALWAAGIVEGDALAHVARTIVDDVDDPAWRWFGASFDRVPDAPALPAWSIAETSDSVQHALGRRLASFGIARTPEQLSADLRALVADIPRRAAAEPETAHVLERCAAALATIVAARLRQEPSWSLLRGVVTRPGQLVVADDAIRIIMAAHLVDLDHRRAGLDQNPGHVPWLGRRLVIEFAGGESL